MIYKEEKRDLFSVDNSYVLAHCVSADFALGKGIAKEFDKRFDMKRKLKEKYGEYYNHSTFLWDCGDHFISASLAPALYIDNVFNLVTKQFYYNKPTYKSLRRALEHMKGKCDIEGIKKIAMPKIGCGLDKLEWEKVSIIIKDVFKDTDIEILVCYQ